MMRGNEGVGSDYPIVSLVFSRLSMRSSGPCKATQAPDELSLGCPRWLQRLIEIRHMSSFLVLKLLLKTREPNGSNHILSCCIIGF